MTPIQGYSETLLKGEFSAGCIVGITLTLLSTDPLDVPGLGRSNWDRAYRALIESGDLRVNGAHSPPGPPGDPQKPPKNPKKPDFWGF